MHTNAHMATAAFHASRGSGPRGHAGLGARGPARVHKNYWQLASKRGAAKELRFLAFSQQMWACPCGYCTMLLYTGRRTSRV